MKKMILALTLGLAAATTALADYPPSQPHACDGLKEYAVCGVEWYNPWYHRYQRGQCFATPGNPEELRCTYAL